jgi:hypothetical protein
MDAARWHNLRQPEKQKRVLKVAMRLLLLQATTFAGSAAPPGTARERRTQLAPKDLRTAEGPQAFVFTDAHDR